MQDDRHLHNRNSNRDGSRHLEATRRRQRTNNRCSLRGDRQPACGYPDSKGAAYEQAGYYRYLGLRLERTGEVDILPQGTPNESQPGACRCEEDQRRPLY